MSDLKIEAGKVYKLRNGDQGVVLEIILGVAVGYLIDGSIVPCRWELSGREAYGSDHRDIISLWAHPPIVDWSKFPAHIVAVAMQLHGDWRAYMSIPKPAKGYGEWEVELRSFEEVFDITDENIIPVFSGDWRDSLVIRSA